MKMLSGLARHQARGVGEKDNGGRGGGVELALSLPARSAGKIWGFYSVSGEIPARSAGKFWAICLASVT